MGNIVSNAPAYKAQLVTSLLADANLGVAGVQVSYGFLARDVEMESVAVGGITWESEEWAPFGTQHRKDETFAVALYVFVNKSGLTQQEATERALQLLGYVETVLRNNIRPAGVHWAALEPTQLVEGASDEGYQAMAEARIVVKARK